MKLQNIEADDVQSAGMGCGKVYFWRAAFVMGLQETCSAQAPRFARFETLKAELWARCAQIIAHVFREGEELGGHHGADSMASLICGTGVAMSVAEIACDRVQAADFQGCSKHVDALFRFHDRCFQSWRRGLLRWLRQLIGDLAKDVDILV
jgi:hypothetical protein